MAMISTSRPPAMRNAGMPIPKNESKAPPTQTASVNITATATEAFSAVRRISSGRRSAIMLR